jgi:CheY-like chemotaxis protein
MVQSAMLAFGEFPHAEKACLREAARASAVQLHTTHSHHDAQHWLDENQPAAILLAEGGNDPTGLAQGTRAQARYRQLPILALAKDPSDLIFADAFSWGADDVVAPDSAWGLTVRLRALLHDKDCPPTVPRRGVAVIAEASRNRRVAVARALFNAGYSVCFALTEKDAKEFALHEKVSLVVFSTEICPNAGEFIRTIQAHGCLAHFIASEAPPKARATREACSALSHCRITDTSCPPEDVVFMANELSSMPAENKRTAPRILFGTTVRYRPEGMEEDDLGFSYNVSQGGIFVRTLAPPQEQFIWLEVKPPSSPLRVRLLGEVVWRRNYGPNGHATVPPGFAVKIVDGSRRDLQRWNEGCQGAESL